MRLHRWMAALAWLAAACVGGMLAISLTSGASQEWYEGAHPVAEYAQRLVREAPLMRGVFTLDTFFLLAYSSFFVLFAQSQRHVAPPVVLKLFLVAMMLATLLDAFENLHILALMRSAELGLTFSVDELRLQEVASGLKFALSYFGAIFFALLFPRDSFLARAVAWSTGVLYPVVGVLAFTTTGNGPVLCSLARGVLFFLGYLLGGILFWNRPEPRAEHAQLSPGRA